MAPSIKNYRILIADQDRELGDVLSKMLENMGFAAPHVLRSGQEALNALSKQHYDFLITEWNTAQLNGIDIIKTIRTSASSTCPTLPVIMLTGRAEQSDVVTARDAGANEYVVKPFSAKTVYNRIERIIEHPRNFVVTNKFVGPDRRSKGKPPEGMSDRRTHVVRPNPNHQAINAKSIHGGSSSGPRIWTPDYSLKAKLGAGNSLQSIITPDVLDKAQSAVNAITQTSLSWIKTDFQQLQEMAGRLAEERMRIELVGEISEAALSISSRAGTFGYDAIAKVAYMLYLFCRNHLKLGNNAHLTVVNKHIDVLYVIMGQQLTGASQNVANEIISGLKMMTEKLIR